MQESSASPQFLFTTCQVGAERALKAEFAARWPQLRAAFSRPGFVTFKATDALVLREDFDPHAVFARAWGFSLGKAEGATPAERATAVRSAAQQGGYSHLHLWQRGDRWQETFPQTVATVAEAFGAEMAASAVGTARLALPAAVEATSGTRILDCLLVEPDQWWLAWHQPLHPQGRWPGGIYERVLPGHAVSRAYLKMAEALDWSQLPISAGDQVVEIGCAPGGASQALLERGLDVLGIDPAEVDPVVLAEPNFRHVRKRGHEVRRREFRKTRWLTADMNVAPQYTLDTVEAIVTHPEVNVQGMLLTLKLVDWSLAASLGSYLERIQSWGYRRVQARQLSHNRQEVCVAVRR